MLALMPGCSEACCAYLECYTGMFFPAQPGTLFEKKLWIHPSRGRLETRWISLTRLL